MTDKPTQEQIRAKLRELDGKMMRLPVGQSDAEYEALEVEYNRLCKELYTGHCIK